MVYVVQETQHNVLKAARFGTLKVVFPQNQRFLIDAETSVARARERMSGFCDDDYVLLIGDPVAIGVVTSLAALKNNGKYKVLKWDGKSDTYWPIEVNVKGETH